MVHKVEGLSRKLFAFVVQLINYIVSISVRQLIEFNKNKFKVLHEYALLIINYGTYNFMLNHNT